MSPSSADPSDHSSRELRVPVPDMDCASCAAKIEASVHRLAGIKSIDPHVTSGTVVVTYDPDRVSEAAIHDKIEAAGYDVDAGDHRTIRLSVPRMDCPTCARTVTSVLDDHPGITSISTRPAAGAVAVEFDPAIVDVGEIKAILGNAGYPVEDVEGDAVHDRSSLWLGRRAIATWIGAVLLLVGIPFRFIVPAADPIAIELIGRTYTGAHLLFIASAAIAGAAIIRNGLYSARNRQLDIHFLMTVGIIGAVGAHHPFEGAALAVLFSIAELLERFSMDRARRSLRELMDLSPDTATVRRNGSEEVVPVEAVAVGDVVTVRPGEKIPMDGIVIEGESAVDQAPITGESLPVEKTTGDEVFAGTINESGYLELEVTCDAGENTIARIIRIVEDAEASKTEREQFVDRFASVYTPVVVIAAIATATLPPLVAGAAWNTWFLRGLTLLVIACPCAFVISTPVSVVSGITSGARNGVLIKGGRYLEAMGAVNTVAIDKTGTLTTGSLTVTDVIPLNGIDEPDLLGCAAALEARSEHPIAEAIIERAESEGVPVRSVDAFEPIPGRGVRAELDGVVHYAGKPDLFADLGYELEHVHRVADGGHTLHPEQQDRPSCSAVDVDCVDLLSETVPALERAGKTVILIGTETTIEGVIAIADEVRPAAARSIAALREAGVDRIVMLTGDNEGTARAIADAVDIDDYRADLLPEEKLDAIDSLERESGPVAMVGDGVNDAPALAVASVGIAMGAAGTDTALETADIALMGDDLTRLAYLVRLSRQANRVIRQNIWSSLGVKAVLAIGAPFGIVTVIHAVLIGDMGMSLGVTGNAMRLANIESEDAESSDTFTT